MKELNIYGTNYQGEISKKRIACRAIIIQDGKILISYEKNNNLLMLPGGGIEKKETLEECLIREIEEETGYLIKIQNKLITINEYYQDTLWINHYYICEIIGNGKINLTIDEKENNLIPKWFSLTNCYNIFKEYDKYINLEPNRYGIYKREFNALSNILEVWDLYDENKKNLNQDHIRGEKLPPNTYHLVVHVWIKNNNNQYLISKRSKTRRKSPLMWECVGGSVLKNEDTYSASIREVKEEVGIDLTNIKGNFITSFIRKEYQDIVDVYEFIFNGESSLELATTDEVEETKWMYKEEIKKLYDEGKLMHTLEYFFNNKKILL